MLQGISPLLSPELIAVLYRMGHGDELVLADAHFPGETYGKSVLRADGHKIADLLDAILPLIPLDSYTEAPVIMMAAVEGDTLDPSVGQSYRDAIENHTKEPVKIQRIERFKFYERTRMAFAVVMTGETAKYGNVIIKKGVIDS